MNWRNQPRPGAGKKIAANPGVEAKSAPASGAGTGWPFNANGPQEASVPEEASVPQEASVPEKASGPQEASGPEEAPPPGRGCARICASGMAALPGRGQAVDVPRALDWPGIRLKGRVLAAPSWVIPGTVAENCRFLSGKVDEVGLLFFEQDACLAYGKNDLPPWLADLGLGFHVHLPADLDWSRPALAAENCLRLMDKVDFLNARLAVLHPPGCPRAQPAPAPVSTPDAARSAFTAASAALPLAQAPPAPPSAPSSAVLPPAPDSRRSLEIFLNIWQKAGRKAADIALENIRECDLTALGGLIMESGMNICLDIGHLFAYNQIRLSANRKLLARTRIFHLSAPGVGKFKDRHLPLDRLAAGELELFLRLAATAPDDATMMPELFNWADYASAAGMLAKWLDAT